MGTNIEDFIDFKAFSGLFFSIYSLFVVSNINPMGTYSFIRGYKSIFHHNFIQIFYNEYE